MDVRYRTKTELHENEQSTVYEVPVDSEVHVQLLSHGNSLDLSDGDDDGTCILAPAGYEAVSLKTKKESPRLVHVNVHCEQHSPTEMNIDPISHGSLKNKEKRSSKDIRQGKRKILFIFVIAIS